jgi:hypothetical protein
VRSALSSVADIIFRRALESELKCADRALRREEETAGEYFILRLK